MLPLSMAGVGSTVVIDLLKGQDETKRFLSNLGFVVGGKVTVMSDHHGDLIVNVKDSRVALDRTMANKIMVH